MNKKLKILLVSVISAAVLYVLWSVDIKGQLEELIQWIDGLGPWSPVIFILFYILTAGYILPVVLVTVMAGFLFGVVGGTVVVSIAFCASSLIVYSIGQAYGAKILPSSLQSSKKFQAIAKALKEDGFKLVFMLRFVPVLSSIVLNLTCGLIRISPKHFLWGTFWGHLPGTILYTYSGFLAKDIISAQNNLNQRTTGEWILLWVGITVTFFVVAVISIKCKRAVENMQDN